MATDGDSPRRSCFYGDLQIVDPFSDLSFEDGSTCRASTTSGNNSRASHPTLKYPIFFRANNEMESIDPMRSNIMSRTIYSETSVERKGTKIGNMGAFPSAKSETSFQRFRRIINRPKIKSLHQSSNPPFSTESFIKRKVGPWLNTLQNTRKRLKYHSFANDGNDIDQDGIDCNYSNSASTKPISFEVSSTKHQLDDHSIPVANIDRFTESTSFIIPGGAYDNRPIFTNMFDGNEYDGSFHRERKVMEPLLKSNKDTNLTNLHLEDRNPTACLRLINDSSSKWSKDETEIRDHSSPANCLDECSDMNIDGSSAVVANHHFSLLQATSADSDGYSAFSSKNSDEEPLLQKSLLVECGCLPRRWEGRRRSHRTHRRGVLRSEQPYRGPYSPSVANPHTMEDVDPSGGFLWAPVKERSSLLDEESFQRELHKLDVLANEVYRNSPELLTMPVNSQLSAIPEVDEDLTQKSSSFSAQGSIDKSQQYFQIENKNYSSLGAMLDNDGASNCTEEPNLFSALDNRSQNYKTPTQDRLMIKEECEEARATTELKKKSVRDPMNNVKKPSHNNFRLEGEEIMVTSNRDDDSTSGISDITEDFLQIPVLPLDSSKT
jgi:hypothetical protein